MTRKRIVAAASGLAMLVFCATAGLAEKEAAPQETTLRGEVVDIGCFCASGKKPGELKCARTCIEAGNPVGILDAKSDTLYLALGNKEASANKLLAEHAGAVVMVKGTVSERNGLKAIRIESILPASTRSNMGFREDAEKSEE